MSKIYITVSTFKEYKKGDKYIINLPKGLIVTGTVIEKKQGNRLYGVILD